MAASDPLNIDAAILVERHAPRLGWAIAAAAIALGAVAGTLAAFL